MYKTNNRCSEVRENKIFLQLLQLPSALLHHDRSDRSALPADATGQTGPSVQPDNDLSGRVSLLYLPPLCIPADELDTTGAKVDVRVSFNKNVGNKP